MTTDNTTPAQAAGLISFFVHPNDINKHNDVFYARIYFAVDVDALLQSKDRQITELVAALKSDRKVSAQWAEMAGTFRGQYHDSCNQITELVAALLKLTRIAEIESIDVDEYDALLAQHAAPEVA